MKMGNGIEMIGQKTSLSCPIAGVHLVGICNLSESTELRSKNSPWWMGRVGVCMFDCVPRTCE